MKKLLVNPKEVLKQLPDIDEEFLYRIMPREVLGALHDYFRLELEGIEYIPQKGPALICPNHSGYSGLDAAMLGYEIFTNVGRVPRILTHHFWFMSPVTAVPFRRLGFRKASTTNGLKLLNKGLLTVLFPEGELGNFKPSVKRYRLQEFKRGFVRMALQTESPIIPTLIFGAEETHINLARIQLGEWANNAIVPIPLNIFPLPAKWKIKFLEPIHLPYTKDAVNDRELVHEIAADVRLKMQKAINLELARREEERRSEST